MAGTEFFKTVTGNYWFSFCAYVLVIATWSALMGNDFISSSWKSVGDTRKRGIKHLVAVTVPMMYMPVYMFFQFKVGDYNEMNSGLVALMFALLHMSRTICGLWQLQIFKQWYIASRECMMSLGYGMKQDDKGDDGPGSDEDSLTKRINEAADKVKVNDLIIDNRLTEGEVRCHLRFLSAAERKELETSPFLKRIGSQIWYTVRSALLLPLLLWSIVKARSKSRAGRGLHIEPKEPEEVWLRWATVLVANAFPEWLSDIKKASSGESQDDDAARYENARDRFASEVLMSAALHSRKTGRAREENGVSVDGQSDEDVDRDAGHSFLSFEEWDSYPMLRKGTFNKQEFFRHACLSGKGLPFETPHNLAATDRDGCPHYSYQKFAGKLVRARDDMPADIGEKAIDFGVAELEWLAIFLSVGRWSIGVRSKQDNENLDDEGDRERELGLPAKNLASQLGFARGAQAFYDVLSGPFLRNTIGRVLWGNRQVSEVSAHIDNWMALCMGEQTAYVESKISSVKKKCMVEHVEGAMDAEEGQEEPDEIEAISNGRFCMENVWKENEDLERQRFLLQLTIVEPEFWHLDKSMSFMGCSMENLRSSLATWVERNEDAAANVWEPDIVESNGVEFLASNDLQQLLVGLHGKKYVEERFVHMRLLWEVQNHLQEGLPQEGVSPSEMEAMMLCVVSFPAICANVREWTGEDGWQGVSTQSGSCVVVVDRESVDVAYFNIENYEAVFGAVCGPQDVQVVIRFSTQNKGSAISIKAKLRVGESTSKRFAWEAWRDAFGGRLAGAERSKAEIGHASWSVSRTRRRISSGISLVDASKAGTGKLKMWHGWLPTRTDISMYEMTSRGFIMKVQNSDPMQVEAELIRNTRSIFNFRTRISAPVSYADADYKSLKHASLIVVEVVRAFCQNEEATNRSPWGIDEDIGIRADRLVESGGTEDLDMALTLYEIAVTAMGDGDALGKALRILFQRWPRRKAAQDAVTLIEGFYFPRNPGMLQGGSRRAMRNQFRDEKLVGLIEEQFEYVLKKSMYEASVAAAYAYFCVFLSSFLQVDRRESGIAAIGRSIVHFNKISKAGSNVACSNALADTLDVTTEGGLAIAIASNENVVAHGANCRAIDEGDHVHAMCRLANMLTLSAEGVPANAHRAAELYNRAIDEGDHVPAMYNLALMLVDGAEGVPANAHRAAELYNRAIDEGDHVDAMVSLAIMLKTGAEGVAANAHRAAELYNRAIDEGDNVLAMYNFAIMLRTGAEGVAANAHRAAELYNRAIDEGDNVLAMYNLANMLKTGAEGVPANADRAAELYNRAIDEGDYVPAMYNFALMLEDGAEGVPANADRAAELYNRAIDEGDNVSAMVSLANMLKTGAEGVAANAHRAAELYNRAIDEGDNVLAMYNFAIMLTTGAEGVPANAHRAAELYNRAIDEGDHVDAMVSLAIMLKTGAEGVAANAHRAAELYNRAIDEGDNVLAMYNFAIMLRTGAEGVAANADRAAELYNRAIDEGDYVPAMYNLANMLKTGAEGVPANADRAAELYNRAIDEGDYVPAMYNLALMLEDGAEGVPANAHRAAELYNRAIDEGDNVSAMVSLANMLKTGAEGVAANAHRAAELYNRAIDEGDNVLAMYNLAIMLTTGAEGVPANAHRAAELYNRAIDEGDHVDAMVSLAIMLKTGAEGVAANAHRAAELYNRAIDEGDNVLAMYNFAIMLRTGAEGVAANAHRAAELYNRAIDEGDDVPAMYNLANMLKTGAEGVAANADRAAELYNRAIDEGDYVPAMYNLALMLEDGAEGVPANAHRAAELYNRAIDEGDNVSAMVSLANMLKTGAEGVAANAHRAAELYNRAIDEGDNVLAMYNFAIMLTTGAEGVPANAHRAAELYNRAIDEGDYVPAMVHLANMLKTGAEGVAVNAHRAAELYNRAIEMSGSMYAKIRLAELLHHGANGLEADASRALDLYTSLIESTGSADAMYSLALLLHFGADGVSEEPVRAQELYTRVMNEAGTGISFFNVRHLLDSGVEGLPPQSNRIVKLYTRGAVMYSLSKLLRDGADGVPADPIRAEQLLQRARAETQMSVLGMNS